MDRRGFVLTSAAAALIATDGWAAPMAAPELWQTLPAPAPLPKGGSTGYVAHDGAQI